MSHLIKKSFTKHHGKQVWQESLLYFLVAKMSKFENKNALAVSLTLPLQQEQFSADYLFPFFDGLIPEGWLLDIAHKNWKINPRDRMGLLLATCRDCIGNISIIEKV